MLLLWKPNLLWGSSKITNRLIFMEYLNIFKGCADHKSWKYFS